MAKPLHLAWMPAFLAADRLDVTGAAFAAGEAPTVPLVEIKEAV